MKYIKKLEEKKPKGAPDWHDSDAPDANGRFRDLSPKKLAAWLIKTRNKDVKRISGSLTQQVVFNRGDDPEYAKKMERTRKEVYKQLGRQDLLDAMDEAVNQFFYDDFKKWAWKLRAKINRMDYEDQVEFLSDEYMKKHGKWHRDENPDYIGAELVDLLQGDKVIKESEASDEMAYGQLEKIIDYAKMIRQRLENGEELDDWMYGKIIKSEDYLNTLADVIDGDDGVIEKDDRDWNDKRKGPHPYTASLSDEDEEDKEKQMKKQAEMDDDDPDAYKEMPGDKKARQKGKVKTSKHVKRYHDLYSESIKEAKLSKIHNAAKKGSYPVSLVVIENGKVVKQELVGTPQIVPAAFNQLKKEYPNAIVHIEDRTGKRLFSESVVTEAKGFKNTEDFEEFLKEIDAMPERAVRKIMGKDYIDTPGFYQDEKDNYEDVIDFMISNMGADIYHQLEQWWELNVMKPGLREAESVKVGEYIKTQYGYFYKRVDGKVGGQEAFVEIKKGKEGKRKTSIHNTVSFEIVDKEAINEAKFVKDFDKDVLDAETKADVTTYYPSAKFFMGKSTHFFGELEPNLFFKAYYAKYYKQDTGKKIKGDFKITSIYSEKGSKPVSLYNEAAITERFNESSFSFGKKKQFGYEDINVAYGFWGTVEMNYDEEQTSIVWEDAFEMLTGYYKFSDDAALYYLNSKAGRHLADKFSGGEFYNMEDTMEDYAKDGQWKKWAKEYEKYAKEEMAESLSHVKLYEEYITERAAAAKRLFKDVVKGNTTSIEGQKISKEMAQAALDWFDRSMYARKYSNQVQGASMGAIAPLIFSDSWGIKKRISSKLKDEFKNLQDYYKRTLGESFEKANKLADDMFGEFGVANLSSKEMKEIIDMKKADKIAKKKYGEFGFATLAEEEMEEVLDDNPELVKEAFIGPFVFNDRMSDDELKAMYNGALDGYANYSKGFQHSKSDYKKAYHEIEKILKKRGVSVDETVVIEEKAEGARGPISDSGIETGLKNKAKETGVPIGLIRIIMRRGMAAWKTGHRPGATQQQWGYARVNSFLTKQPGTWGGADKDVAKEVRDGGHDSGLKK